MQGIGKILAAAAVLSGLALLSPAPVRAEDEPALLMVGAGSWEVMRDNLRQTEADIDYRSSRKFWIFRPHVGFLAAGDGDVLGYAGFLTDVYFGRHVVSTLSTSVGVWGGNGFNLGSRVEFHSGVDLAWRFDNAARLGLGFYHTSNADLTRRNPGSESLLVSYSHPIRW